MSKLFKGIALFTPGGDIIYAIDFTKKERWHSHLCSTVQELLKLPEPPHFLIPGFTATIDRWLEPTTGEIKTAAEIYPSVFKYQNLLNVIFNVPNISWESVPWIDEICNPMILETYREQFPQLWESHEIIFHDRCFEKAKEADTNNTTDSEAVSLTSEYGYVLRLFVTTNNPKIFENLHQLLETKFPYPYSLKIIDITKHPEEAERHQVTATPTLVRIWPEPVQKIVGEFEESDRLLKILIK